MEMNILRYIAKIKPIEFFLDEFFYFLSSSPKYDPKSPFLQHFFMLVFVTIVLGILGLIVVILLIFAPQALVPLGFLFLFFVLGIAFIEENNKR